jgi:hypothetical protein
MGRLSVCAIRAHVMADFFQKTSQQTADKAFPYQAGIQKLLYSSERRGTNPQTDDNYRCCLTRTELTPFLMGKLKELCCRFACEPTASGK